MVALIPAIIGIYLFNKISSSFRLFIYMIWLDVIIETILYLYIKSPSLPRIQHAFLNFYMLVNFFVFLHFLYKNNYIVKKRVQALQITALVVFVANCVFFKSITQTFFYLLCFVSFTMMLLSIDILSKQMMSVKQHMIKNFWFWMSVASIIYNAQTLLIFALYFFALSNTKNGNAIGLIETYVHAGCYLIFCIALFNIPLKQRSF